MFVIAPRFSIGRLKFFTEMAAAGLGSRQCVVNQQFGKLQKIGYPARSFQILVERVLFPRHFHASPKLFAQRRNSLQ